MSYPVRVLVALTQLLNALLGGYPDESTSSRAYRLREHPFWNFVRWLIDGLFFFEANHCMNAYISEMTYRQLPPDFRK